jgi:hypothetical protein
VKAENITPNVLKAMEANDAEKLGLIRQYAPKILHSWLKQFAAVKGSTIFNAFQSGEMVYLSYILQKRKPDIERPG